MHTSDADKNPVFDLAQSLDEPPRQPDLLKFPKTRFGSDLRSFKSDFYKVYPWIEYSTLKDAVFCYPCRFFSIQGTGSSKTFISEGYKNWKRASETKAGFKYHNNSFQHKSSMVAWQSYKSTKIQQSVTAQISSAHTELIRQNREYIKSIIRCIIYLSTQGLALRGHDESNTNQNRGNFLELVDLMSRDNTFIAKRLLEGPKNARYTHHSIQNELIRCLAELTIKHISGEVKEACYFALMADETKDLSKTEQLSIVVRYYLNGMLYERFLGFEAADKLDASSLFQFIRKRLSESEIDISFCVAQTYDGANVMSGKVKGLQTLLKKQVPQAIYIHCFNHALNLVVVDMCKNLKDCNIFFSVLENLYVFISGSSVHNAFSQIQKELHPGDKPVELKRLSDTRWTSHISSCLAVKKTLPAILILLNQYITENNVRAPEANGLLNNINFTFLFNLEVFCEFLSKIKNVSDYLQSKDGDILKSLTLVESLKQLFVSYRQDSEFEKLWTATVENALANNINLDDVNKKRSKKLPSKFNNTLIIQKITSLEEDRSVTKKSEFQVKLYYPIIDRIISELCRRFDENAHVLKGFSALNPSSNVFLNLELLTPLVIHYGCDLESVENELKLLPKTIKRYEMNHNVKIKTLSDLAMLLQEFNLVFHEINKLCNITITIPSSSASCERSFTALKRIKNYLRTTMSQERLTYSGILYVEKNIVKALDLDVIVDSFATKHNNRRIALF